MKERDQEKAEKESARGSQLLALLTERHEKIAAQIRRALAERKEAFQTRDAPGSHGWGAAPEGSESLAMVKQQEQLLAQIEAAIRRHKSGTYGRCAGCGEEIPLPRLKALPFAQRCAQCQEDREQKREGPAG